MYCLVFRKSNKSTGHNIVFMKKGRTEVIEKQYINQHLHQKTEYYEGVGSNSTSEQYPASVTGERVPNSPSS
jgi:hypothetical protein